MSSPGHDVATEESKSKKRARVYERWEGNEVRGGALARAPAAPLVVRQCVAPTGGDDAVMPLTWAPSWRLCWAPPPPVSHAAAP